MLKEYWHGLQTRASLCGHIRLELAGFVRELLVPMHQVKVQYLIG